MELLSIVYQTAAIVFMILAGCACVKYLVK